MPACQRASVSPVEAPKAKSEAGYSDPPAVELVTQLEATLRIEGRAEPMATVRLRTPTGTAATVTADGRGHWMAQLPRPEPASLYGLSQTLNGQVVQAWGYVLVLNDGRGFSLRSGTGARRLGEVPVGQLTACDFDRAGGGVVSGRSQPQATISLRMDGRKIGEGRADPDGTFSIPLSGPISPGTHVIKVFGSGIDAEMTVNATPAAPLTDGPFRSTASGVGLRIDWMSPAGGVQSTWIAP